MKWLLSMTGVVLAVLLLTTPVLAQSNVASAAAKGTLPNGASMQVDRPVETELLPGVLDAEEAEPPKIYSPWALLAVLAVLGLVAWAGITLVRRGLQSSRKRRRRRHRTA